MIPSRNALEAVEIVELTNIVSSDTESRVQTRWERKQQQEQMLHTTPRKRQSVGDYTTCSPAKSSPARKENQGPNRMNMVSGPATKKPSAQTSQPVRSMVGTPSGTDRFIPVRSALDFDNASFTARSSILQDLADSESAKPASPNTQEFNRVLQANMGADTNSRILHYKSRAPVSNGMFENPVSVLYSQQSRKAFSNQISTAMPSRNIPSNAIRILDAPGLRDDFYINPLDWSVANEMAVGLGTLVYFWSAATQSTKLFLDLEAAEGADEMNGDHIGALKFVQDGGGLIAIGSTQKSIGLWDVVAQKRVRPLDGHLSRVNALAWNGHILTSGGRDSTIFHHDVRMQNHIVSTLKEGHVSEVCSLKWNEDGTQLASGGNDHTVCIWDIRAGGEMGDKPRLRMTQHTAAVKAIAWCPYQRNVIATGGGTSDRTIKIWNTMNGTVEQSVDTGSQVSSLIFNPHEKELLSSHGFSNCELTLWKFPTMAKLKDLTGHSNRILHMAVSPDGSTVCSGSADESLRFWDVFGQPRKKEAPKAGGPSRFGLNIR